MGVQVPLRAPTILSGPSTIRSALRTALSRLLPAPFVANVLSRRSRDHQVRVLSESGITTFSETYIQKHGLLVRHGPFRELTYTPGVARNRIIVPKLLGTYELELHDVLKQVVGTAYDCIVDIGCAEGYYTTGLALCSQSKIVAFDTEPEELSFAREMAEHNHVSDRIDFRGWCSSAELIQIAANHKKLFILSDCEGYETELFTPPTIRALTAADLLIELHGDAESLLVPRFAETHQISIIPSRTREDIVLPELTDIPADQRWMALTEYREKQHWLWATTKLTSSGAARRQFC